MDAAAERYSIILFDGQCNLCNRLVQFVIQRDPRGRFHFASLQSELGSNLVTQHGRDPADMDTMLLIQSGRLFARSTAALRIVGGLRAPWPLLSVFLIVPAPLRDLVYRWIARNRYRWFGRRDACMMPTADIRARFLTD